MFLIFTPGPGTPAGEDNVVQWVEKGEAITYDIGYSNGRLLIKKEGYYYLYSKVTLNAVEECRLTQHKVMKRTKAYDLDIELMKSKRLVTPLFLPSFLCRFTCAFKCLLACNMFVARLLCIYCKGAK